MKLSRPCFLEAGRNAVDTDQFERDLQVMISNTSLTSSKIVRWEDSSTIASLQKQETVTHYWHLSPRDEGGLSVQDEEQSDEDGLIITPNLPIGHCQQISTNFTSRHSVVQVEYC